MGQLLVVEQSRLKEIQTLAHPELIPGPTTERTTESRTWDPAGKLQAASLTACPGDGRMYLERNNYEKNYNTKNV